MAGAIDSHSTGTMALAGNLDLVSMPGYANKSVGDLEPITLLKVELNDLS
jgi:hypothetical protein